MHIKSKIIAVLSTAVVTAASVISFSGSAAQNVTYNDPYGNGVIDMSDSVAIMQYISGAITPENVDRLDFDNNGVVTMMDSYKIQMYRLQLLGNADDIVTLASPAAETPQGDSSSRYRVFNAKTREELILKNYTLTESTKYYNDSNNSISTRSVIGTDDRVIDWSKNGVVKIVTADGMIGSGFVVGKHTIATAAHCVNNKSLSNIILFDNNGNDTNATPVEYHIPQMYYTYADKYDYALITVEEDLSDYMQFDLGTVRNYSPSRNIAVTNTGFPGEIENPDGTTIRVNDDENLHNLYSSTGSVVSTYDKYFCHTADTSGGDSGSPVYYTETINGQTYYTVIGIQVGGGTDNNKAMRITTELIRFYNQNPHIN
ncbi:trypsin-like peptidase domain-containing protein [Anaerofustis sp.]|uniref:trypsin-like peptidase domain-containing protein n=1 Tax=Anaerofustis sp. TaxID=1872517 RepID=UPI0025C18B4D|nr:trypsin-like peptidase domain-containing protein [Anaerofustis sp.]